MKQKLLLKTMLLLCALIVGSGTMWGTEGDEITSIANIVDGKSYYIKGVRNISGTPTTFYLNFTDATTGSQSGTESSTTAGAQLITFHQQSAGVYYLETASGKFIAPGTSNGKIQVAASGISVTASNQSSKIRLSITSGGNTWSIQKNTSAANFGGYKNTQTDITLIEGPAPVTPCAIPTFSPAAGTYSSAQTVTISTETDGATIYYSTDGSTPTSSSTKYIGAITVSTSQTIKAIAVKDGNSDSEVATAAYTITSAVATTTTISASGITNTDVYVSTTAGSFAATVKDNEDETIAAAAVTWSSSNTDVATINATTGAVTLVAAGSTTITASYAGVTDTYQPSSDTYELTVTSSEPYVQPTSVTFNMNYEWLGSSNGSNISEDKLPVEKEQDNVSITITDGTSTHPRGDDNYIRVYKGSTVTFEAPAGYDITGITFTEGGNGTWNAPTADSGTFSDKTWSGTASSVEFTLSGTCFISSAVVALAVQKTASDLALTSSSAVALEKTSVTPNPMSTITWTTSSTGAMTFTSSNTSVATVTSVGVVTAVGAGEATITFSQAADENYKASTDKSVTVTVTDSRSACASSIDLPAAQKTLAVGDIGVFAATSTKNTGLTGTVVYTYSTSDASIVDLDEETFSAEAPGTANITVTATPTGGNADNYKPASQIVTVKVNAANSISLDLTSKTQAYSAGEFDITATVPTANYDGTVSAKSSNTAVATVSVDGTTVTVTPVAVGTATITVTAGTGTYYPATAQTTCAVTVTAPEGKTTAPSSEVTYTFDFIDNTDWEFPTDYTTGENTYTKDGKTITLNTPDNTNGYKFNSNVLLIGKSGATLTLPAFDKPVTKISTTGKTGASSKVTQNIFVGETAVSTSTSDATKDHEYAISSSYQEVGTIYTLKVTNGNNTQIPTLTVHMYKAPTVSVKLNAYGYATFCSECPLDFTTTEGYTAWQITGIDGKNIVFSKITGTIKGGQGILLKGTADETVTLTSADSENVLSGNKLYGTTAPTYAPAEIYYGLKANAFVPVNAGTVPAGKALLPASAITGSARELKFVFEDSETTSISDASRLKDNGGMKNDNFFNLKGQRIAQPTKGGLYIVNGKKVVIK